MKVFPMIPSNCRTFYLAGNSFLQNWHILVNSFDQAAYKLEHHDTWLEDKRNLQLRRLILRTFNLCNASKITLGDMHVD